MQVLLILQEVAVHQLVEEVLRQLLEEQEVLEVLLLVSQELNQAAAVNLIEALHQVKATTNQVEVLQEVIMELVLLVEATTNQVEAIAQVEVINLQEEVLLSRVQAQEVPVKVQAALEEATNFSSPF